MVVLLNRERFEPSLVKMSGPGRVVVRMPALRLRRRPQAIYDSAETRLDAIDAAYCTLLRRPADPTGLKALFNSNLDLTAIREVIDA